MKIKSQPDQQLEKIDKVDSLKQEADVSEHKSRMNISSKNKIAADKYV